MFFHGLLFQTGQFFLPTVYLFFLVLLTSGVHKSHNELVLFVLEKAFVMQLMDNCVMPIGFAPRLAFCIQPLYGVRHTLRVNSVLSVPSAGYWRIAFCFVLFCLFCFSWLVDYLFFLSLCHICCAIASLAFLLLFQCALH